ncbi:hypothetical protein BC826DRAFT_712416 [Russula brevipes]|nr:hypothetical protein BC826DRAFT_712416 [Russula brevipes]
MPTISGSTRMGSAQCASASNGGLSSSCHWHTDVVDDHTRVQCGPSTLGHPTADDRNRLVHFNWPLVAIRADSEPRAERCLVARSATIEYEYPDIPVMIIHTSRLRRRLLFKLAGAMDSLIHHHYSRESSWVIALSRQSSNHGGGLAGQNPHCMA